MRLAYFIPAMSSHLTLGDEWSQETEIIIKHLKHTQSEEGYVQDRFCYRFLIGVVCTAGKTNSKKTIYLNRRALLVLIDGALALFVPSATGE